MNRYEQIINGNVNKMNGMSIPNILIPTGPDSSLLQNAAMTARARRRHHSTPRIRHWLEDVMEQSRLSTPFIFDENDEPVLSPRSPTLGSKDNGMLLLGALSHFSNSSKSLIHKHSYEVLDDSEVSSGPSFSDCEPQSRSASPASERENSSRNIKTRSRPNLTIKVNNTRYKTNYCIAREQYDSSSDESTSRRSRPPTRGKALSPRIYAPAAPSSPVTKVVKHSFSDLTTAQVQDTLYVPMAFPTPPPLSARGITEMQLPLFVKTSHGIEELQLPHMPDSERRLRQVKSQMEEKSARMLDAAVKERGKTTDYLGDDGIMVRRKVLMEAVGRAVDNGLGYESFGLVKRKF
ncbi:Hypothetical protein D9617_9g024510 [Elsinoe fawcettii]|nr:Hypothetical protein D9617_9g024510 [Elsinoe fawcettii]